MKSQTATAYPMSRQYYPSLFWRTCACGCLMCVPSSWKAYDLGKPSLLCNSLTPQKTFLFLTVEAMCVVVMTPICYLLLLLPLFSLLSQPSEMTDRKASLLCVMWWEERGRAFPPALQTWLLCDWKHCYYIGKWAVALWWYCFHDSNWETITTYLDISSLVDWWPSIVVRHPSQAVTSTPCVMGWRYCFLFCNSETLNKTLWRKALLTLGSDISGKQTCVTLCIPSIVCMAYYYW